LCFLLIVSKKKGSYQFKFKLSQFGRDDLYTLGQANIKIVRDLFYPYGNVMLLDDVKIFPGYDSSSKYRK